MRHRPCRRSLLLTTLLVALSLLGSQPAAAQSWQPKTPPLSTAWTAQVSATNALPEYPRPQLTRSAWQNLNGVWEFAAASAGQTPPFGQTLAERILVPFPAESALSGIMRRQERMWYRRSFSVPAGWAGQRVMLNFGAVDWQATVYVNGQNLGSHQGGFDSFSLDITGALRSGSNELIVGVYDPTDAGGQPIGKQRNSPSGIWYTPASGIWQTVWMEPVPSASITRLDMTPDVPGQALRLTVRGTGISGQTVEAVVLSGGAQLGSVSGAVGSELRLPIPSPHLWSPEDPFLYDLQVRLRSGSTVVDQVGSYVGMRSVGLAVVGGVLRPVINGKFVFQIGTLDQGYWPDGIYTAPTDAALRSDLELHKALGYNMVRKHIKVEPARWYYWADRLGLLVWQDMPSMNTVNPSAAARQQFELELRELVDEHRSFSSLVLWVIENEGWGQYDQSRLAALVKSWDPSRLVDNMSGINCCGAVDGGNGDVADWHVYVGPGTPTPSASRAAVLGEFGGLGLRVSGHMWNPSAAFSYEMQPDSAALTSRYLGLIAQTRALMDSPGLSAAVYTEIVDVENEINGMATYDRAVIKVDVARVKAAHDALVNASRSLNGPLRLGQLQSLQVTTPGFTDRALRHRDGLGETAALSAASDAALKQDATFRVVAGLANSGCYSFESRNFPGHYLRHSAYRIRKDARDGSALFDQDATFCARAGLGGAGVSLESLNLPGRYIRHYNAEVWLANASGANAWDSPASFAADATWSVVPAWWKSGADLPLGQYRSLQVVTPGFTDRYLRHRDSLGETAVVNASSDATLRQDATFRVVAGLADSSCYSFESRNFPGHYLRHSAYRVRKDPRDGSALFDQDATFCAQPGPAGGTALASLNETGRSVRHYDATVWVANGSAASSWDNPTSFPADIGWNVVGPWAP